jgi:hypothetical protein
MRIENARSETQRRVVEVNDAVGSAVQFFRRMRDCGRGNLGDSVSVEDFQNFRVGRRVGRSVDVSVKLSFDNARAHALSVLINTGPML